MFQSFAYLSSFISEEAKSRQIHYCARYPKVEDIKEEKSVFNDAFEFNNMLNDVINKIKINIEIKCTNLTDDIIFLLNEINNNKKDLLVAQAESIIITKNAFILIKLENVNKTNKSGRCIFFDIDKYRMLLESEYNDVIKSRNDKIFWSGLVLFNVALFGYIRHLMN